MRPPPRILLAAALALLPASPVACAHDTMQCSVAMWLREDRMDVEVLMARTPSRNLVANLPNITMTEDNFSTVFAPLFKEPASDLFVVVSNGETLKPRSATVELSEEMDVSFHLVYPLPATGPLSLTAPFVKKMEEGYMVTVSVNRARKNLGYGDLMGDDLTLELEVPPLEAAAPKAAASPPPPPSPVQPPPAAALPAPIAKKNTALPLATAFAVVLVLAGAWATLRHGRR